LSEDVVYPDKALPDLHKELKPGEIEEILRQQNFSSIKEIYERTKEHVLVGEMLERLTD
jgi:hypothetical protein